MNELTVFQNDEFGTVRTVNIDGEPWFIARDVAEILGYSNSRKAIADHVDEEDRNYVTIRDGIPGNPNQVVVSESGLYSLILSSKLPRARDFKRWVTSEVLPAIRRHGVYAIDDLLNNPDAMITALQALKEERELTRQLRNTTYLQAKKIMDLAPKASYYDLVLSCPDALPISMISKDYGWSARKMNEFLHGRGVQYKLQKTWLLYAKYAGMGYTRSETCPYRDTDGNIHNAMITKWTQKGRLFIYNQMKDAGYLPLIERDKDHPDGGDDE